jgi:Mechanosensitive ion channel, conserved TM helix
MATFGESTTSATQSVSSMGDALEQMVYSMIAYLPKIIGALIILFIGWVVGRILGKVISRFLDKVGVDDALAKTSLGKAIERTGTGIVAFFDLVVRWFVYLIALLAAANVLGLAFLTDLMHDIVVYLPHVLMFLIILIAGFIVVDFFADIAGAWAKTQDIEFLDIIILGMRVFFYFIVGMLALSQLLIDLTIIYTFVTPIAWGVGLGVGAGIAGLLIFGLKDRAPGIMDNLMKKVSK